jgi:uncharacterized protein DUF4160
VPTALRIGPYRFFFYAGDRREPPHVHVERDDRRAKLWLDPCRLASRGGFGRQEVYRIERLVGENQVLLLRRWHEYFSD